MVRLGFYEAIQDSKKAKPLSKIITNFNSKSAIIKVYEGANFAIMAQNKWNPFAAISLLKKSNVIMNPAVISSRANSCFLFFNFKPKKSNKLSTFCRFCQFECSDVFIGMYREQ